MHTYRIIAPKPLYEYEFTTKIPYIETAIAHITVMCNLHGLVPSEFQLFIGEKEINTNPNDYNMAYYNKVLQFFPIFHNPKGILTPFQK